MAVPILKQSHTLIASIQSALSDRDLLQLRDDLADLVGRHRARGVIVDVTALDVLDMEAVRSAKVGHIVATLKHSGRQHAVVAEYDAQGRHAVRGLFSATQIARQLGVAIQHTSEVANTFSQIEAQLAR